MAEKGLVEMAQALSLFSHILLVHELVNDEDKARLGVVTRDAKSWTLLLQYDEDLYPSVEVKAAHLLYFVIKDHSFSDGNKWIRAFLFLFFLGENDLLEQAVINENGLVALALLIAESDPRQKDLIIRLVENLLKI